MKERAFDVDCHVSGFVAKWPLAAQRRRGDLRGESQANREGKGLTSRFCGSVFGNLRFNWIAGLCLRSCGGHRTEAPMFAERSIGSLCRASGFLPELPPIRSRSAFTLLELMLAVTLMAAVCTVTYLSFSVVSTAWKKGMALSDELHHGDFVIEQLTMGLRSAYYPSTKANDATYGFQMNDGGEGEVSGDEISWVKLGGSLVGSDCSFAGSPHRVVFSVGENKEGQGCAMIKAWQVQGQPEDFDPDRVEPIFLSGNISGFNCRVASGKKEGDEEIDWLDEWEETNRLPTIVEVTLYLKPLDEGERPVEIKRVLTIPAAPLSWIGMSPSKVQAKK